MRKFISIVIFLVLMACQYEASIVEVTPSRASGCGEYSGVKWQRCIIAQVDRWQEIENAPLRKIILERERVGWSEMVKEHVKVCRASLCSEFYETRKSPAWYHETGKLTIIGILAGGAGYIIGAL